jgi:hypothetical protein
MVIFVLVWTMFNFTGYGKSQSQTTDVTWSNGEILLLPVCFADLESKLPIEAITTSTTDMDNPLSAKAYFKMQSYGKLILDYGTFVPKKWYKLDKKISDYKKTSTFLYDSEKLVRDCVAKFQSWGINLKEYDKDIDGLPDRMCIVTAGFSNDTLLAWDDIPSKDHKLDCLVDRLFDINPVTSKYYSDLLLYSIWRSDHNFRFDDFFGINTGVWDYFGYTKLQAYSMCAANRAHSNWLELKEISKPGIYEIDDLNGEGTNKAYKIKMPGTKNEWVLIENRQKSGYDAFSADIIKTGLVMYHFQDVIDTYSKKPRIRVMSVGKDSIYHVDDVWSLDSGNAQMSWQNCSDNEPNDILKYTGPHVQIKNISKSGPKMTFELAYENNSPEYITDTTEIDFGDVRKGLSKTLEAPFFYNFTGEIVCQFVTKDFWLSLGQASAMLGKTNLKVTVNTQNLDCGKHNGKVEYLASTAVGDIKIKVNVTHPVGDVNLDYKVDKTDADLFMKHYGTTNGDPDYNINADFDGNGKVDIEDFFLISKYFGE